MGQQIIKQPDGQLAIFSTTSDTFVMLNATEEEVVKHFVDEAVAETENRVRNRIQQIKEDTEFFGPFSLSWKEAVDIHKLNQRNSDPFINLRIEEIVREEKERTQRDADERSS